MSLTVPAGTSVAGLESGIQTPEDWARAVLTQGGWPGTTANIDFLVSWAAMEGGNWNNTATFNPLNTTLRVPGSTVMSGGNTAGVQAYQSWNEGITATLQTLSGYPQITAALKAGAAMSANNSGSLAGDLSKWSGGGYTQIGQNTSYASTTGGPTGGAPGATGTSGSNVTPTAPGLNDIPALDAYIRQNFGTDAWLLDIPSVKDVLEKAVAQGLNTNQIQAAIQQTAWWQSTSQAVKNFEQQSANNPADYSFANPGSVANQTLSQIRNEAGTLGVQLSDGQAQELATNALKYGWSNQQIQQAIGTTVTYAGPGQTNAGSVIQNLNTLAGQYLMSPTPQVMQSWAQNIAAGTQTLDQFKAYLTQNASLKWTGMASQIQQGYTPNQIIDNYRSEAAKTMEVDPNSIDFVNNPTYSKILDFVPPDSKDGVHRLMTQSEMDQYLKGLPQWGYTQQARDTAATFEDTVTKTWGRTG